jgi:cell division protein FtsQ
MERRREVAEDRARRTLSRLIKSMILVAVLGAIAWVFLSPMLSVAEVRTAGIVSSMANQTLVEQGLLPGTPMVFLRPSTVEAALESDPWIRDATVELHWPDRVVVKIEERVPLAWVEASDSWERTAVDGVPLGSADAPDEHYPRIQVGGTAEANSDIAKLVLGSLDFVQALPPELRSGATIDRAADGELWANVEGFDVRLGRETDMEAKALSLTALLKEDIPSGSVLTLIAPAHPAITLPAAATSDETGQNTSIDSQSAGSADTASGATDGSGEGNG